LSLNARQCATRSIEIANGFVVFVVINRQKRAMLQKLVFIYDKLTNNVCLVFRFVMARSCPDS
jgi:uncharacterized protein YwgA